MVKKTWRRRSLSFSLIPSSTRAEVLHSGDSLQRYAMHFAHSSPSADTSAVRHTGSTYVNVRQLISINTRQAQAPGLLARIVNRGIGFERTGKHLSMHHVMKSFREVLSNASNILILTGSGISAESGVPTFRGAGGFWRKYQAQNLATPEAFAANPSLVWEFYEYRRQLVSKVEANKVNSCAWRACS